MFKHIAIIGAGPAGCALACMLRQRDLRVTLFDDEKKPELLVGESLIPAAVPILQRLGIENRVAEFSTVKRGAALRHHNGQRVDFEFQRFNRNSPEYAYNIPRPQFDQLIRERADELGAEIVRHRAGLLVTSDSDKQIVLDNSSLAAAGLSNREGPDLIVDASGRARQVSRLLKIPSNRGPRNDIAYFAHFDNFDTDSTLPGQVVLSVLKTGWSWQIPLADRTSVGVVIDRQQAQQYGNSAAERLFNIIHDNPVLRQSAAHSTRLTEVKTYANYQLISEQAAGPGWLLLGDALGFVDPMLSPGVFMALESACLVDHYLFRNQPSTTENYVQQSAQYFNAAQEWHNAWSELIEYFYNGQILTLGEQRNQIQSSGGFSLSKFAEPLVSRILAQMVAGNSTRSRFHRQALYHTFHHLIKSKDELRENRINSTPETEFVKAA